MLACEIRHTKPHLAIANLSQKQDDRLARMSDYSGSDSHRAANFLGRTKAVWSRLLIYVLRGTFARSQTSRLGLQPDPSPLGVYS